MRSFPEPCLCGATDCVRCYGSRAVTTCPECGGEGRVPCSECDGKGCEERQDHEPVGTDECAECSGTGECRSREYAEDMKHDMDEDRENEEG